MSNCGASALRSLSGEWLYTIGLPGKSGIGGGIVMVSPGKGGLGTFAPQLDAAGNSVKGQLAAPFLRANSAWICSCPPPR
jgi:glutaminase